MGEDWNVGRWGNIPDDYVRGMPALTPVAARQTPFLADNGASSIRQTTLAGLSRRPQLSPRVGGRRHVTPCQGVQVSGRHSVSVEGHGWRGTQLQQATAPATAFVQPPGVWRSRQQDGCGGFLQERKRRAAGLQ